MLIQMIQDHWYNAEYWTAISGGGQLVAAVVAGWAAWEAKRSAEAARDAVLVAKVSVSSTEQASRHRDRAYIAIERHEGTERIKADTNISLTVHYKNVGVTPAYQVEFASCVYTGVTQPSEQELESALVYAHSFGAVPPSISIRAQVAGTPEGRIVLGIQRIKSLTEGKLWMVIATRITYTDVFGDKHETRAAYEFYLSGSCIRQATYFNQTT